MQIITVEDREFNDLLNAWKTGKMIGRFWRNGSRQVVCATNYFMLISNGSDPKKIAIRPTRSLTEAEEQAIKLLTQEEQAGNRVEFSSDEESATN